MQCPRIRSRQVRTVYIFSRWGAEQPLPVQDGDRDFGRPGSILLEKGADRLGSVLLEKGADRPGVYTPKSGESRLAHVLPPVSLSLSLLSPSALSLSLSVSVSVVSVSVFSVVTVSVFAVSLSLSLFLRWCETYVATSLRQSGPS